MNDTAGSQMEPAVFFSPYLFLMYNGQRGINGKANDFYILTERTHYIVLSYMISKL